MFPVGSGPEDDFVFPSLSWAGNLLVPLIKAFPNESATWIISFALQPNSMQSDVKQNQRPQQSKAHLFTHL